MKSIYSSKHKVIAILLFILSSTVILLFANFHKKTNSKISRPKISVVIPVYNAEKFLRTCLDSILNQIMKDIEIICVDDKSPDKCGEILDEYAKKDNRIKVIHKEKNGGVSAARNDGINIATGEYITFCDDDDIINPNTYEYSYEYAKNDDIDLLKFGCKYIKEDENNPDFDTDLSDGEIVPVREFDGYGTVWNCLFKSEIIKNNDLKFLPRNMFEEDYFFLTNYLLYAKKIKVIPAIFYYYRQYSESLSNKPSKRNWNDAKIDLLKHVKELSKNPKLKNNDVDVLCILVNSPATMGISENYYEKVLEVLGDLCSEQNVSKCPKIVQDKINKLKSQKSKVA